MSRTMLSSLPKPKYSGEEETVSRSTVIEPSAGTQLILKQTGPPPYGQRQGYRPDRQVGDGYGDGGAFPELGFAQYPLGMGKKGAPTKSNALATKVDSEGKTKYDELARRGHSENRIVQASFKDLIPLRQRADAGEKDLSRPSAEEVQASKEKTQAALQLLISGQTAAQNPKNVRGRDKSEPTFVKYTPSAQMGNAQGNTRVLKIQNRQLDPMEPPKFKFKRIPRGPGSPPPPVLHSPPRKLTAEDQANWRIPPAISNWKNPKGYTVPLDKRLAAEGKGLMDVTINDKFAQFAESLQAADRHAREEVHQRALMQQKLAEKEKLQREENLRQLAQKAREERASGSRRRRSSSYSSDDSETSDSGDERRKVRQREEARREKRQEHQREMRQGRMGTERRIQIMAREQNRDISEKVALGIAKPSASGAQYDSRLFNQQSGFDMGFNEDQHYDKPLFAAQDAISSIYRPSVQQEDDQEDNGETYDKITKSSRFEVLGKAKEGFKGTAEAERREGPVQFEKDTDDPFNINEMINEVTGTEGASKKRYGIQENDDRSSKRARIEDDDD